MRIIWQRPDKDDVARKITRISKILTEEEATIFEKKLDDLKLIHKRVKDALPSTRQLSKWSINDGVCPTPDGCKVEPDGTCQHGWSSWLLIMHVI